MNKKTLIKKAIGLDGWDKFKSYVEKKGAEKLLTEMNKLKGRDYVVAYSQLLEFVKPKLNRTTLEGNPEKPISLSNATITFK